jgi:hypothetical protein
MPDRWLGVLVASEKVIIVDAAVPDTGPLEIQADHTWSLQGGDRPDAYNVMHQHFADYVRENNIERVVIKGSALSMGPTKMSHLEAAELRGVIAAAAAGVAETEFSRKASISRTFGKRKVDDYLADDAFWLAQVAGAKLRLGSREAAMVLLAARKK